jgi:hypothetical protein
MTYTERNGLRVVIAFVVVGWIGQIVGAVIHGGIGGTSYTWFARALWLCVTVFAVVKYRAGVRDGFHDE